MVNGHLGWSKVMWVGQRSLGLNGVCFDTFEAIIHKKLTLRLLFAKALNLKVVFTINSKIK